MQQTMPCPVATTIPERNTVPYQNNIPESSLPGFCPMVPPIVRRYRDEGKLKSRDVDLISLMMGYKNDQDTLVWPSQATLAARMHVKSVDTVQRCLRRIIALGLIVRKRERAARGQFDKVKWDLAALWADLDRHLEKSRLKRKAHHAANSSARRGAKGGRPSKAGGQSDFFDAAMPQPCGPEAEPEFVVEADNSGEADSGPQTPPSAVVVAFRDFSLGAETALSWEAKLGEVQCLEAARIMAAQRSAKTIPNVPGYFMGILKNRWTEVKARAEAAKVLAVKTLAPKPVKTPKAPPAPDPLVALPQDALTALERQTRAVLAAERPAMRSGYEGTKYGSVVRDRMRAMLLAGWRMSDVAEAAGLTPAALEPGESVPSSAVLAASMPPIPAKYLSAQDLEQEWGELPDARRVPYRERARCEVQAAYVGRTPRPEAVESRAQNLYIADRKKA